MKRTALLCGVALITSIAAAAPPSQSEARAIPNLASAEFGWQVSSGLNFLSIPGKLGPVGNTCLHIRARADAIARTEAGGMAQLDGGAGLA